MAAATPLETAAATTRVVCSRAAFDSALTLKVGVVAVVHILVGVGALAQEALLVRRVHVLEQLVLAVEPLAAEAASNRET